MTLIERVAFRIAVKGGNLVALGTPEEAWALMKELDHLSYRLSMEIARAAIEEMRDVDAGWPHMLAAGKKSLYSCSSDPELEDARQCWQAMIDAALEEV
jgi:hypothetical protein